MKLHPQLFIDYFVRPSMKLSGSDYQDDKLVLTYMVKNTNKYLLDSDPALYEAYQEASVWLSQKLYNN